MALWTPADTTTAIWLDAADASTLFDATTGGSLVASDGAVARIEDKSGNARHLTQGTLLSRPLRKTSIQNSLDVLRFDGSNDWLESTFAAWGTSHAVIVVGRATNAATATAGYFVCRSNSSALPINPQVSQNAGASQFNVRDDAGVINSTSIPGLANNTWYLLGGTRSGNVVTPYRDGTAGTLASNSLGAITPNRTTIGSLYAGGATPTSYLSGDIGEVIVCGLADRQKVEGYTAWRWGLQGGLPNDHPYKNGPPTKGGNAAVHFFTFGY
jgi:hypothetical protein